MRFGRKKDKEEEEEVSGHVMPGSEGPPSWSLPADAAVTQAAQGDTVDMEAVAPATAAGGAGRENDPDATVEHNVLGDAEEADRRAEEARLADEEAKRAGDAEAEARWAEAAARKAEEETRREAEAAGKARAEAEQVAKAQREADEKAREAAATARAERAAAEASTSVSGASITSPGLGSDVSPGAAAAANAEERERPAAPADRPAPPLEGPLAPILSNPAVQKKPELLVVGGLAAGFVVAKLLRAMGGSNS